MPASDKRHVWEVIVRSPTTAPGEKWTERRFNISARMVNSALSKAARYMKDHKFDEKFMIVSLSSIAVIDY